jgi:hypothetical protein
MAHGRNWYDRWHSWARWLPRFNTGPEANLSPRMAWDLPNIRSQMRKISENKITSSANPS